MSQDTVYYLNSLFRAYVIVTGLSDCQSLCLFYCDRNRQRVSLKYRVSSCQFRTEV